MHKLKRKISNSALNSIDPDLNGSPSKFMKFMNRDTTKETDEMKLGKLIHKTILEPKKFIPEITTMPEPGVVSIMDEYFKNKDKYIIEIAKSQNYRQNWKDKTIEDYVLDKGTLYLEALRSGKDVMDVETYNTVVKAKLAFSTNPKISELVNNSHNENEFLIEWDYRDFECKGIIDKLVTDSSCFSIADLKVTSKPIQEYYKTFRQFKTYRQIAFYELGLMYINNNTPKDHYIFVISLYDDLPIAVPFLVEKEYVKRGMYEIDNLFDRIEYHIEKNNWSLPMEIIEGNLLTLQLPSFLKLEETKNWYE